MEDTKAATKQLLQCVDCPFALLILPTHSSIDPGASVPCVLLFVIAA